MGDLTLKINLDVSTYSVAKWIDVADVACREIVDGYDAMPMDERTLIIERVALAMVKEASIPEGF